MPRQDADIPQGRVRRTAPVAALTARTAGEAVVVALRRRATGREDPDFHLRSAERYAELLGRSKGALMKAGQMLSFTAIGPAVPSEFQAAYRGALARLRADVPPMPAELVRPVSSGSSAARPRTRSRRSTGPRWPPRRSARSTPGGCTTGAGSR